MNQIQLTLLISYLFMTSYFLSNWLKFAVTHPTSSPEDKFLSFVMFLISTVFWPLIIPISCVQIYQKRKFEFSTIIPVLLAVFAFSISYYLSYVHGSWFCHYDLLCPYAS